MRSLRSTWLALIGAMLLVTLSVSAAFGAAPSGTVTQTRGQTIAAFVHDVVFGNLDEAAPPQEANLEECEAEETAGTGATLQEETLDECDADADECEADETLTQADGTGATLEDEELDECEAEADELEGDREVPDGFANHGECVSTAAKDRAASEASEAANHGAWVSEHARYTCWNLDPPTSEGEEEDPTEAGAEELAAETAAAATKAEQKAEKAAARAEKKAERAEAKPAKANSGGGKPQGKGGGRP